MEIAEQADETILYEHVPFANTDAKRKLAFGEKELHMAF
jgi:hypothetical protein